jgi:hypothetical protein
MAAPESAVVTAAAVSVDTQALSIDFMMFSLTSFPGPLPFRQFHAEGRPSMAQIFRAFRRRKVDDNLSLTGR